MKLIIKTSLFAISLLAFSCKKEMASLDSFTSDQSTQNTLSFSIGQRYGGGIIFYLDSTRVHGLIADTVDFPACRWWPAPDSPPVGVFNTSIGSGYSNTKQIFTFYGNSGHTYAAKKCWKSKASGYTDWFLPSRDELMRLYKQRAFVGGFKSAPYWSSSEYSSIQAWAKQFVNGETVPFLKGSDGIYVREIRAF